MWSPTCSGDVSWLSRTHSHSWNNGRPCGRAPTSWPTHTHTHTHAHTHRKTSISEQCGVNRGAHNHTGEGEEGRRGSGDRSYISRWSYEGCWPLCPWAPLDPSCPQTDGPHCGSTENPPRCCCLTRADKSENTEGKGQGQKTDRKERRENASWR